MESQAQIRSISPSVEIQMQPNVDVTKLGLSNNVDEAVGINEPEVAAATTATTEPDVAATASNEPISFPSFSDIREYNSDDESSDEALYDLDYLCHDPGKRFPIRCYNVNDRNSVIRGYIALGPCQPKGHDFPLTEISGKPQRFVATWFDDYWWLEYSVEVDAVFCFVCYLFKHKTNCSGGDAFVTCGFGNWHMKKRVDKHIGGKASFHNFAQEKYDSFLRPRASIVETFADLSTQEKALYLSLLTFSLQCLKLLLHQGLASRGNDESENSLNKGNFLESLNWLANNFEEVNKVVLKNAPKNCKLTGPKIQKDIINCCAKETTKLIMADLGGDYFAILADESSDVYQKEQLALCLCYVDKKGRVVERFLGVVHVEDTTALTLKSAIVSYEFVFMAHLMYHIFGYTNDLNHAMQKRDQDIVNAIELIELTKFQLQTMREDQGWEDFLEAVNSFCVKHGLKVADMDGLYKPVGRDKRFFVKLKNMHRFHVDMFLSVIDMQLQELNDRFDEVNTELLMCMAAFNPIESFAAYNKDRLVKLAGFYLKDFSSIEINHLPLQLDQFIKDMHSDERFREVQNIVQLSIKHVETKKNPRYDVVYKLLKLVLVLPVATASVERVFASMNYVNNKLRNRMGDQYLNDCLVTFIEREFFQQVKDSDTIKRFQRMKKRKVELYFT